MTEINKIASKHLGQQNQYIDVYNPSLLVKIPRHFNRTEYGINDKNLPFVGYDVWNAYEVSVITAKGLPINFVLKMIVPAESECIVESKSFKLYLNSFNMTKLGSNTRECQEELSSTIKDDLTKLLDTNIQIYLHNKFTEPFSIQNTYSDIGTLIDLDQINFSEFNSDKSSLKIAQKSNETKKIKFSTNLLRSNCRVTNQPDWGDAYICLETNNVPCYKSIAKYIVGHRQLNHFHEEIAEMLFMHFLAAYEPKKLMVTCLYTRRGGIDINPIRSTHAELIPTQFISSNTLNQKTLRQ
ncbi:MAG: 7-cyano-7-deazaguanine reductase [Francisellaceae bacterium]|jgi:7-cyano-7-deazaguanine reductase